MKSAVLNESTAEEIVPEKEKDYLTLSPMKDKKDEDIKLESPDSAEFNQQNHEEVLSSLDTDEHNRCKELSGKFHEPKNTTDPKETVCQPSKYDSEASVASDGLMSHTKTSLEVQSESDSPTNESTSEEEIVADVEMSSQSEANKSLLAVSPEEEKDDLVLALRKDENNEDTKLESPDSADFSQQIDKEKFPPDIDEHNKFS